MDQYPAVVPNAEEGVLADRMRMDSFRLGKAPPSMNNHGPRPSHARSHSRNTSVSVPVVTPTPPNTASSVTTIDEFPSSSSRSSLGASKRNSHHRRRSSVSTRRESADMMGVSLPSVPPSSSDDNINLGDKDSLRRRALWTLEGKTDVGSFSKVEIPEFDAVEAASAPKRPFEFPSKPSFPPGIGSKRDSLSKFMASVSSKDQLHTLLEEEEEEDNMQTLDPVEVMITSHSPAPSRRRPATLNLRPLSLVSASVIQATNNDLPTPVLTPSPSARPGLRSLTLGNTANRRQSLITTPSPSPLSSTSAHRPSLNLEQQTPPQQQSFLSRRSSISYVCSADTPPQSVIGLPTPEMTPTTERTAIEPLDQALPNPSRPLSTSEQFFLFQAHATLVQRITDLERALSSRSSRSWSRPASGASDASAMSAVSALSEPSDEMLQLIADLKAERDELKRDVDGWRVRVGDLEHQVDILAKRVDGERREAWVARQRVGLLEVEKSTLENALSEKADEVKDFQVKLERARADAESTGEECTRLKAEVEKMQSVQEECARLKALLEAETEKNQKLEHDLEHAGLLDTPRAFDVDFNQKSATISRTMMFAKARGLGFQSIDSESSFTDVESVDSPRDKHEFGLKAVAEEDEETLSNFSEEDELARFEDEEEGDADIFPSMSGSSISSEGDRIRTPSVRAEQPAPPLTRSGTSSPTPLPSPVDKISHARRASLSKAWTFPAGGEPSELSGRLEDIDHFFDCLEGIDNSPPTHSRLRSLESSKNLFAQGFADDDDDELPPFVLPADVGIEVASPEMGKEPKHVLDVVAEEEEEDDDDDDNGILDPAEEFVGEVDEGGIKFTFTIPPEYQDNIGLSDSTQTPRKKLSPPAFEPVDDEEDSSFTFPQSRPEPSTPSPSSIPRRSPARKPVPSLASTPTKASPALAPRNTNIPSAYMTPPTKRGGTSPTLIPQLHGSSLKSPSPPNVKGTSFIPQPRRVTSPAACKPSAIPVMSPITNTSRSSSRSPRAVTPTLPHSPSSMNSDVSPVSAGGFSAFSDSAQSSAPPTSPTPMSPTLAARLSFQTLTNFMPSLPWSPRSKASATAAAAAALCFIPESSSNSSSVSDASVHDHMRSTSSFVNPPAPRLVDVRPTERTYVQREKQLEKLKIRMEEENRSKRRGVPSVNTGRP
ncbi:uncharacterized protein FIBRA_06183 [Fibroporia radiculosa]|uniref:Uncharacterized protein n=1 Tax=Fibroporia radiculosa TaxID=599839 RepID=J4IB46_9APHY|nr:uncharacterized protein FIBRA_06183 [Fibroporia radiculosa]CCM04026.1 predicted protein [Fibroporia radiculosa]